jgi:hypothetical protein
VLLHRLADSATVVTGAVVGLVADAALPVPFDLDSGSSIKMLRIYGTGCRASYSNGPTGIPSGVSGDLSGHKGHRHPSSRRPSPREGVLFRSSISPQLLPNSERRIGELAEANRSVKPMRLKIGVDLPSAHWPTITNG